MSRTLKFLGLLAAALALGAVALPAGAHGSDEAFTLVMSPGTVSGGAQSITATLTTQADDDDRIKSFRLYAPVGLTITSATSPSVAQKYITVTANQVSVTNVSLSRYSRTVVMTLGVTFPAADCAGTQYVWGARAWEDSYYSSGQYTLNTAGSQLKTNFPLCNAVQTLVSPAGSGTLSCTPNPVPNGGSTSCTANAASGWGFVNFTGDCSGTSCTLNNVISTKTVTANFAQFAITTAANPPQGGAVNCTPLTTVPYGGSLSCTASTNNLYTFTGFSGGCSGPTCSLTNVTAQPATITGNFVPNVLSITPPAPTSAALNAPFDLTVGINPGPATVTPDVSACANASVSTKSSSQTSITFTFTIPSTATSLKTCTLGFAANNYTSPPPLNLTVFQASAAACSPPTSPDGVAGSTFDVSATCSNGVGVNVSGFAAGFRSVNKDASCPALNFTMTNNICGPGPVQDANSKTIPPNAVSLVWDSAQRAAFTYTVTWKAEYVDPVTGLPIPQQTKYCTGAGANACDTKAPLKACKSPDVAVSSIPTGEPACIKEEDWVTVPQTECPAWSGPGAAPVCVRTTTVIIDAVDPPIIRG